MVPSYGQSVTFVGCAAIGSWMCDAPSLPCNLILEGFLSPLQGLVVFLLAYPGLHGCTPGYFMPPNQG